MRPEPRHPSRWSSAPPQSGTTTRCPTSGHHLQPGVAAAARGTTRRAPSGDPRVVGAVAEQHRLRDVGRIETPRPQRVADDVGDHPAPPCGERAVQHPRSRSATPGRRRAPPRPARPPRPGRTGRRRTASSIGANAAVRAACATAAGAAAQRLHAGAGARPGSTAPPRPGPGWRSPRPGRPGPAGARPAPAPPGRRPTSPPPRPSPRAPAPLQQRGGVVGRAVDRGELVVADRVGAAVAGPVQRDQPDPGAAVTAGSGSNAPRRARRGRTAPPARRRGVRGQVVVRPPGGRRGGSGVGRVRRRHGTQSARSVWVTPCCHRFSGILDAVNRTERLYAIAEELRAAGPSGRTGSWLARRLEVSTRTIKRDVDALLQAGLPLWAQAGRGGGYVLDAATPAAAEHHRGGGGRDRGGAGRAAGAAVRGGRAQRAGQGAGRDAGGGAGAGRVDRRPALAAGARSGRPGPPWPGCWTRRCAGSGWSCCTTPTGPATPTERAVEPVALAATDGHWHLLAWCRLRRGPRWFRTDRITAAHLTAEPAPGARRGHPLRHPAPRRPPGHAPLSPHGSGAGAGAG